MVMPQCPKSLYHEINRLHPWHDIVCLFKNLKVRLELNTYYTCFLKEFGQVGFNRFYPWKPNIWLVSKGSISLLVFNPFPTNFAFKSNHFKLNRAGSDSFLQFTVCLDKPVCHKLSSISKFSFAYMLIEFFSYGFLGKSYIILL